ncbi:uncharacterized protein LOC117343454 [Pecten maximus]|uniref:uncharacterized protein LOC117343454 n=1 Tax=Pecten maximus TaxID=6579 RepID=UPI00145829C8|nr:uncharacterized protein LOC117343454 [Pecten maximus]
MTANASLEFYDKDKDDIIYSLTVVAPNNGTDILEWWTNIGKFNRFDIAMEAFLDLGELPQRPSYVTSDRFGIKSARISYTLTKGSRTRNRTDYVICKSSSGIEADVLSCNKHVPNFDYRLDNADVFTMRFEVTSGGYMELRGRSRSPFHGKTGFKEIRLKIDFEAPYHCQEDNTCGSTSPVAPLKVVKDITRDPVILKWAGWEDELSGLHSYILEVFKLSGSSEFLLESDPNKPTYVWTFGTSVRQHTVTPNEPGMYSAILGVKDRANNTRYVRELFLYDSTSDISMEASHPIHVTSASPESNYHWQIPNTTGKTSIEIDWTGHFVNKVHQEGGFLASVIDYPTQLKNDYLDTVQKAISTELRNPAANRTSDNITNSNGIIRFEFYMETFIKNAPPPTTNWKQVPGVSETITIKENVQPGNCESVWVRAYDIVGNNATDRGMVCFDGTLPIIREHSFVFEQDSENEVASRLFFEALDHESGIAMVKWSFTDNATHQSIEIPTHLNLVIPGKKVNGTGDSCQRSGECYCITTGECFSENYQLDIDHCVLYQPRIENTETHYITTITVYNQAMLNMSAEFVIENVQNLGGMDFCARKFRLVNSGALTVGGTSGIVISCSLLLVFAIFVVFLHKTGRLQKVKDRSQERIRSIRQSIRRGHGFDGLESYKTGGFNEDDIYMYGHQTYEQAPEWRFSPNDLTLNNLIVVGKFARIYEASVVQSGQQLQVVAKVLKAEHTEEDAVLMTAKINFFGTKVGRHSCILELIGAVLEDDKMGPVMILERCGYGSVKDWLGNNKAHPDDSTIDFLFRFVYSIVQGMEYLASKEITHMRLAARNILLTDKLEPKISGFGPRHGDDEEDGEKKERIPVKWIAPECLRKTEHVASEKSDVWSYGVVMWEIFAFGETPYPSIRSAELPRALKKGERLSRPEYCDENHYKIMKNSWNMKPAQRPTFREIREEIEKVYSASGDDNYYDCSFASH